MMKSHYKEDIPTSSSASKIFYADKFVKSFEIWSKIQNGWSERQEAASPLWCLFLGTYKRVIISPRPSTPSIGIRSKKQPSLLKINQKELWKWACIIFTYT